MGNACCADVRVGYSNNVHPIGKKKKDRQICLHIHVRAPTQWEELGALRGRVGWICTLVTHVCSIIGGIVVFTLLFNPRHIP